MARQDFDTGAWPGATSATRRRALQSLTVGAVGGLLGSAGLGPDHALARHERAGKHARERARAARPDRPSSETDDMQERTGAVRLFVSGQRPAPKSVGEIRYIGDQIAFFDEGRVETKGEGYSVTYVPRTFTDGAEEELLTVGLLVTKFTVTGRPPAGYPPEPGTYYLWVDYAEARWFARVVGDGGLACVVPGVEVKQIVQFGTDLHEEHSKPRVVLHDLGFDFAGDTSTNGVPSPAAPAHWVAIDVGWKEIGVACSTTTVCAPNT